MGKHDVDVPIDSQTLPLRMVSAESAVRVSGANENLNASTEAVMGNYSSTIRDVQGYDDGYNQNYNYNNNNDNNTPDPILWSLLKSGHSELERSAKEYDAAQPNGGAKRNSMWEEQKTEYLWSQLRQWFQESHSPEQRRAAATFRNYEDNTAPLHLLCQFSCAPADIARDLLESARFVAEWKDNNGWLPLHFACLYVDSLEVFNLLLEAYPASRVAPQNKGLVPLNCYFIRSRIHDPFTGTKIVSALCRHHAAERTCMAGMTPFHYACAFGVPIEMLRILLEVYQDAMFKTDKLGRLPLHLAACSASPHAPANFEFLLRSGGAKQLGEKDAIGDLPLKYLVRSLDNTFQRGENSRANTEKMMLVYLDCIEAPKDADYFSTLRDMPYWLQVKALRNPGRLLQRELNKEISKTFPTMVLMLDLYFLIALIVCFQMAVGETISCLYNSIPTSETYPCYLAALLGAGIYFFIRELVQIISFYRLGIFWNGWLYDGTNYVDVVCIILTFFWLVFMWINCSIGGDAATRGELNEIYIDYGNDWYRNGMALTAAVYWTNLFLYLRTTLVEFAVFVGGVFSVLRGLAPFLASLLIVLIAFAQAFFNVSQGSVTCVCTKGDLETLDASTQEKCSAMLDETGMELNELVTFCNFRNSLLQVYYMLLGQVQPNDFVSSTITTWIYCAFMFLAVVLLANILIAIVTETYTETRDQKSSQVFWSNRFAFLVEVESIGNIIKSILFPVYKRGNKNGESGDRGGNEVVLSGVYGGAVGVNSTHQESTHPSTRGNEEPEKDHKFSSFLLNDSHKFELWKYIWEYIKFETFGNCRKFEIPFVLIYMFFLGLFSVIWVLLGAGTAGLLWPPQVRWYLLKQRLLPNAVSYNTQDFDHQYGDSMGDAGALPTNKMQLKVLELQEEIRGLKTEVEEDMKTIKMDVQELCEQQQRLESKINLRMNQQQRMEAQLAMQLTEIVQMVSQLQQQANHR